jgi:hypothetical protein
VCVCVCVHSTTPCCEGKAKAKNNNKKENNTQRRSRQVRPRSTEPLQFKCEKKKKMPLQREWTGCTSRCQLQLQAGNAYTLQQQKQWLTIRPTKYEATAKHEIKTKE